MSPRTAPNPPDEGLAIGFQPRGAPLRGAIGNVAELRAAAAAFGPLRIHLAFGRGQCGLWRGVCR
ncbi:hypothetical protein ACFWGI_36695 [Streptomyces niveus]|uniref:hypothetical protein n=1 Tax=Streptomyces niveus TaxID=193462 RepID=UPI0036625C31